MHDFHASKVRGVLYCDTCSAPRCFYLTHCVGSRDGRNKQQLEQLLGRMENGYYCGYKIDENGFYYRRALWCGDFVESQYYMPNVGTKGDRILTLDICSICFSDTHIVPVDEIRTKRDLKGKNPLLVCRYCFDSKVEIPTSGGRTNFAQKKQQEKSCKRRMLNRAVHHGRHKGRKV